MRIVIWVLPFIALLTGCVFKGTTPSSTLTIIDRFSMEEVQTNNRTICLTCDEPTYSLAELQAYQAEHPSYGYIQIESKANQDAIQLWAHFWVHDELGDQKVWSTQIQSEHFSPGQTLELLPGSMCDLDMPFIKLTLIDHEIIGRDKDGFFKEYPSAPREVMYGYADNRYQNLSEENTLICH